MPYTASLCTPPGLTLLYHVFRSIVAVLVLGASSITVLAQPMQGTFTVGSGSSNYPNLAAAAQAVTSRGAASHVTFLIRSGTYTVTSPILTEIINGASLDATVTFRPEAGASVRITGNLPGRGTFTMRGSSFIRIEGRAIGDTTSRMTLVNTSSAAGSCAVLLDSNTDNSTVTHCTILSNGGGGTGSCVWVRGRLGGCGSDSNTIEENVLGDINAGSRADCGVLIEGGDVGDPNCNRGNVVRNNTIVNMGRSGSEGYGVRIESFCMGTTVSGNAITITNPTGVLRLTGISDNSSSDDDGNNCRIDGNRVWGLASTAQQQRTYVGIAVGATNAGQAFPTQVALVNNMISMTINGRREEAHAIAITAFDAGSRFSCRIDFNTVMVRDTSARDDSFTYTYTTPLDIFAVTAQGRPQFRMRNNIWDIGINGGEGWHIECDGCDFSSDYNLVSIAPAVDPLSPAVNYRNTPAGFSGSWLEFSTLTQFDRHSIEGSAEFAAPASGDLHIVQCGSSPGNNRGQAIAGVTLDFDGEERSATPDIGADETGMILAIISPAPNARILAERPFQVQFTTQKDMRVSVDISCDSGDNWQTLKTVEGFAGFTNTADPIAPATPCPSAMIRVRGEDGRSCVVLNGTVSVYRPAVQVTAPNGGERYSPGDSINITWTTTDATRVSIEYRSTAATGGEWTSIATNVVATLGTYRWGVPGIVDSTYQVRVLVTAPVAAADVSDTTFRIAEAAPEITLLFPNGREGLIVDSTVELLWNVVDVTGGGVVEWSPDSGENWRRIDTLEDITVGHYPWKVPDNPTARALLRVRASDGTVQDISDGLWRILREAPGDHIVLLHPNGGETIGTPSTDSVVWVAPASVQTVQVQYSTDGGAQWFDVAPFTSSFAGPNTLEWRVPALATSTSQALVRVVEVSATLPQADTSDAPFTMSAVAGGVDDQDATAGLLFFPNPTHGEFSITLNRQTPSQLRIVNNAGISVWSASVPASHSSFVVTLPPELPAGTYLLECRAGDRTFKRTLILLR